MNVIAMTILIVFHTFNFGIKSQIAQAFSSPTAILVVLLAHQEEAFADVK